jgi:hypothetical protein
VLSNSLWYNELNPDVGYKYTSWISKNDLTLKSKQEMAHGITEHLMSFSGHWGKLYRTSALAFSPGQACEIGHLIKVIPNFSGIVIIPEILHFWTQRSDSASKKTVLRYNHTSMSPPEMLIGLHAALLTMLNECGCETEENLMIVNQNIINQLCTTVISYESVEVESLDFVYEIAKIVLAYLRSHSGLRDIVGYDELVRKWISIEERKSNV